LHFVDLEERERETKKQLGPACHSPVERGKKEEVKGPRPKGGKGAPSDLTMGKKRKPLGGRVPIGSAGD